MDKKSLLEKARAVREHAYAPYSRFKVGAALLGAGGEVFCGCNVENASYGLTCCAERAALYQGVSQGERTFTALALAAEGEVYPCGACLQALAEFAPDLEIYVADDEGTIKTALLKELLPTAFSLKPPEE